MDLQAFIGSAIADIHGKLHHRETVTHKQCAELCCITAFGFRVCRQIKEDKQPHYSIFVQANLAHIDGYTIDFTSPEKHLTREAVVIDKATSNGRFILGKYVSQNKTFTNSLFTLVFSSHSPNVRML